MHMAKTRTTLIIRDDLLAQARRATGIKRKTDLLHAGLEALIQREAAEYLAGLYGRGKGFTAAPRRKNVARTKVRAA